jgi:fructose-1,6-bisphosphatase I
MDDSLLLDEHLARHAGGDAVRLAIAKVVGALAGTAIEVAETVSLGALAGIAEQTVGQNAAGDAQKDMDIWAHRRFRAALRSCPVAAFASEEAEELEIWDRTQPFCLAMDPIDGSANLDVNMPVGTIFSIVPTPAELSTAVSSTHGFAWPVGTAQLAAGFVIYGPQTTLVLTLGGSVDIFTLDRRSRVFRLTQSDVRLHADGKDEYSVNASNYRHWEEPVRTYIDECLAGVDGPHGRDFNMRWHGALVADTFRVLTRGGIYLYPADARNGYGQGRLRLIYEAYPMAFLIERAGGAASNGRRRILEVAAKSLHQRIPLILGSAEKVERLEGLHNRPSLWPQTAAPLFASRGLFKV